MKLKYTNRDGYRKCLLVRGARRGARYKSVCHRCITRWGIESFKW